MLTARLTPRAWEAWHQACHEHRVSTTALCEALGELLADGDDWIPEAAIRRAKDLDRERKTWR